MAHDRNSDPGIEKALRRSLGQSLFAAADGKDCPDPSILAAYFDRELAAAETERWEAHFSVCARCQEQLALLARIEPTVAAEQGRRVPVGWSRVWTLRWLAPLATAAAAVMLWVVIRPVPTTIPSPEVTVASRQAATAPRRSGPAATPGEAELDKEAETRSASAKHTKDEKRSLADTDAARGRLEAEAQKAPAEAAARTQAADEVCRSEQLARKVAPQTAPAAPVEKLEAPTEAQKPQAVVAQKQPSEYAVQTAAAPTQQAQQVAAAGAAPSESKETRDAVPAPAAEAPRSKMATAGLQKALPGREGLMGFRGLQGAVVSPDGKVMWRFGVRGLIEKSADTGKTWSRQQNPVTVDLVGGSAPSEKVCWAIGMLGTVLRTSDGGHWEQMSSPTPKNLSSITARDALNATVTTADGKTFVTSDGGQTWHEK